MPRRLRLALAVVAWAAAAGAAWGLARGAEGGLVGWLERTLAAALETGWAAPAVLAAYLLRPLFLLPVTVLTVFVGFWLGPFAGVAVALVGATASAMPPFLAARRAQATAADDGRFGRWALRLRRHAFSSILTARLAMLPGDAVNVAAGAARAPVASFVAATAVGGLPGLVTGVLAGAGLRGSGRFAFDGLALRPGLLVGSAALLAFSLVAAWAVRRWQARPEGGFPKT